jgi:hypothetical protein
MPDMAASNLEAICAHVDRVFGQSARHLHERYSPDNVHIDLLHYPPNTQRDFHYLVTSGVSDLAMSGVAQEERLELTMALPAEWDISPTGFQNPSVWEPVKLLKILARYPHTYRTSFAKGHTIPLGEERLLSPMAAALLMPSILVPELTAPLESNGVRIHFLAVYLIHEDELELKLSRVDDLIGRFANIGLTELYDLTRPSVLS